jgi:putative toxin-antitoxin system antitoxin component (TIGR02293 family)
MATLKRTTARAPEWSDSRSMAAGLFGGQPLLRMQIHTSLDVHGVIQKGLPSRAYSHLCGQMEVLEPADVLRATGLSVRTVQRRKSAPGKPLSVEQSGRAWKFAEVLAKATEVFGSQKAGEEWLAQPAVALEGQKPIELLSTPVGTEMVERLLGRIEFGVYT